MGAKRDFMPSVRAAIAKATEPFRAVDIYDLLALTDDNDKQLVRTSLWRLAHAGELESDMQEAGGNERAQGKRAAYRRTKLFRAEEFDPWQQKIGAEFLQALMVAWCSERERQKAAE